MICYQKKAEIGKTEKLQARSARLDSKEEKVTLNFASNPLKNMPQLQEKFLNFGTDIYSLRRYCILIIFANYWKVFIEFFLYFKED